MLLLAAVAVMQNCPSLSNDLEFYEAPQGLLTRVELLEVC